LWRRLDFGCEEAIEGEAAAWRVFAESANGGRLLEALEAARRGREAETAF
jgi:hypothetical protein